MTERLIQRIELSDDVQRALAESEDVDEAFRLMDVAADFYQEHGEPMTLEAALAKIREIAAGIEAL